MTGRRPGAAYVLSAILALAAAGCVAAGQEAEGDKATVVHVVDGDTFDVQFGEKTSEVDGGDVGRQLVRDGLARWVPWYADEDPRLAAMYETAEQRARDEGVGFWSSCGWK